MERENVRLILIVKWQKRKIAVYLWGLEEESQVRVSYMKMAHRVLWHELARDV